MPEQTERSPGYPRRSYILAGIGGLFFTLFGAADGVSLPITETEEGLAEAHEPQRQQQRTSVPYDTPFVQLCAM